MDASTDCSCSASIKTARSHHIRLRVKQGNRALSKLNFANYHAENRVNIEPRMTTTKVAAHLLLVAKYFGRWHGYNRITQGDDILQNIPFLAFLSYRIRVIVFRICTKEMQNIDARVNQSPKVGRGTFKRPSPLHERYDQSSGLSARLCRSLVPWNLRGRSASRD